MASRPMTAWDRFAAWSSRLFSIDSRVGRLRLLHAANRSHAVIGRDAISRGRA